MEFHLIDFVQHTLNIIVLFLLLRTFLYKPVQKFMAEREEKFTREKEAIAADRAEAARVKAEYEGSMKNAKLAADALMEERRQRAESDAQELIASAREQAQQKLADAHAQAVTERDEMLQDLRDQTAALAVDLAARILNRELREEDNRRIIDEYFEKVG